MQLIELIKKISNALVLHNIPYMIIGGQAALISELLMPRSLVFRNLVIPKRSEE